MKHAVALAVAVLLGGVLCLSGVERVNAQETSSSSPESIELVRMTYRNGADLRNQKLDHLWIGGDRHDADFSGADMSYCVLNDSTFINCSFRDANLSNVLGSCYAAYAAGDEDAELYWDGPYFSNCDFEGATITGAQDLSLTFKNLVSTKRDERGRLMLQNCWLNIRGASDDVFGDVESSVVDLEGYEKSNRALLDLSDHDLTGLKLTWRVYRKRETYTPRKEFVSLAGKIKLTNAVIRDTGASFTGDEVPIENLLETQDFKEKRLVKLVWRPENYPSQRDSIVHGQYGGGGERRKLTLDFTDFTLIDCVFIQCDLSQVDFTRCRLVDCVFVDCDALGRDFLRDSWNAKTGQNEMIEFVDLATYRKRQNDAFDVEWGQQKSVIRWYW